MKNMIAFMNKSKNPKAAKTLGILILIAMIAVAFQIIEINQNYNPENNTSYIKSLNGLKTVVTVSLIGFMTSIWISTLAGTRSHLENTKIWQLAMIASIISIGSGVWAVTEMKSKNQIINAGVDNMWIATQGIVSASENPEDTSVLKNTMYLMQINNFQHSGYSRKKSEDMSKIWLKENPENQEKSKKKTNIKSGTDI